MIKFRLWDLNMKKYFPQYLVNELTLNKINSVAFIVEQFTGLQGKNGKDIYVGDIVKYWGSDRLGDDVFETIVVTSMYDYGNLLKMEYANVLEVIGNVNENKELLE